MPATRTRAAALVSLRDEWSGRQDLNLRPLDPQSSALPGCATPRLRREIVADIQGPGKASAVTTTGASAAR